MSVVRMSKRARLAEAVDKNEVRDVERGTQNGEEKRRGMRRACPWQFLIGKGLGRTAVAVAPA